MPQPAAQLGATLDGTLAALPGQSRLKSACCLRRSPICGQLRRAIEEGCRQRDREALEKLTALEGIVLATGGGAVLLPGNRRLLRERGYSRDAHRKVWWTHVPEGRQLAEERWLLDEVLFGGGFPSMRPVSWRERYAGVNDA